MTMTADWPQIDAAAVTSSSDLFGGDLFGDELMDLRLPRDAVSQWLSQGGRDMAAAHLLPRAEAALRQELQRLADAVKRAREG